MDLSNTSSNLSEDVENRPPELKSYTRDLVDGKSINFDVSEDQIYVKDPLENYLIIRLKTLFEHKRIDNIVITELGHVIKDYLDIEINPHTAWNKTWKRMAQKWDHLQLFVLDGHKLLPPVSMVASGDNEDVKDELIDIDLSKLADSLPIPNKESVMVADESDNESDTSLYEDEIREFTCDIEPIPQIESHYVEVAEINSPEGFAKGENLRTPKACISTPRRIIPSPASDIHGLSNISEEVSYPVNLSAELDQEAQEAANETEEVKKIGEETSLNSVESAKALVKETSKADDTAEAAKKSESEVADKKNEEIKKNQDEASIESEDAVMNEPQKSILTADETNRQCAVEESKETGGNAGNRAELVAAAEKDDAGAAKKSESEKAGKTIEEIKKNQDEASIESEDAVVNETQKAIVTADETNRQCAVDESKETGGDPGNRAELVAAAEKVDVAKAKKSESEEGDKTTEEFKKNDEVSVNSVESEDAVMKETQKAVVTTDETNSQCAVDESKKTGGEAVIKEIQIDESAKQKTDDANKSDVIDESGRTGDNDETFDIVNQQPIAGPAVRRYWKCCTIN